MRIEPLGHRYQDTVTAPTCTAQGVTTHVCSVCGDTYEDAYTAALGHDWQTALVVPPTAETEGLRRYTCARCGAVREETIKKANTAGWLMSWKYLRISRRPACIPKSLSKNIPFFSLSFFSEAHSANWAQTS